MTAERTDPKPGETWRHCKGTVYEILDLTPDRGTEDNELSVRYALPCGTEEPHARRMSNFMSRHTSGAWRFEREVDRLVSPEEEAEWRRLGEALAPRKTERA